MDGIIVKFDDYVRLHEVNASSVWDEDLLRTIREGLERLKPSADTALASLWQEYRQNSKEWGAAAGDTEIEDKCAKRAAEIERRIIDDQRAMLAVLDDVDRLAGFNEPRRVWSAS